MFTNMLNDLNGIIDIDAYVFPNPRNKPFTTNYINGILKEYAKKAGIQYNIFLYTFRHTFCTRLKEAEIGIDDIQKLMGH